MKKVLFTILLFMIWVSVKAEVKYEKKIETPLYELNEESFSLDRQRNYFMSNGFITVDYNSTYTSNYMYNDNYVFTLYDEDGKELSNKEITIIDRGEEFAINSYKDNIYMFVRGKYNGEDKYFLFRIDNKLNITLLKSFELEDIIMGESDTGDSVVSLIDTSIVEGKIAFYIGEFNYWTMKNDYKINTYDLESLSNEVITYDEESYKKYFYEDYLRTYYGNSTNISYDNEYVFVSNIVGNFARLDVYKDNKVELAINSKDYAYFGDAKILEDYIIVIAYKGEEGVNQKGDLLIYDMNGNLLDTISNNDNYHSLEVLDNKLLVGRYYVDGVCNVGGHHYSIKEDCIAYVQHIYYEFDIDNSSIVEEESNPETSSLPIIGSIILAIGGGFVLYKSYINLRRTSI